jgi:YD repeat-containing protein
VTGNWRWSERAPVRHTEDDAGQVAQYTYDADGNTLSKVASATDQTFYHWDFQNRMVSAAPTLPSTPPAGRR